MKLIPFRMTSRITAVFTACLLLCSCGQKEDNPSDGGGSTASLENVQFAVPDKMEIEYGAASISFRVQFSKMPAAGDQIVLGGLNPCSVQNISSSFFDVNIAALWDQGFGNGSYTVSIRRGQASRKMGQMQVVVKAKEEEGLKPAAGSSVYGKVICGEEGVPDVVISDGVQVVKTDKDGVYQLASAKYHKYVFMSVPSGYEPLRSGILPVIHSQLSQPSNVAERVDFQLRKVSGQENHTMLMLGDIHLANRTGDRAQFKDFVTDINAYTQTLSGPVYGLTLGDMTWDLYWETNSYGYKEYLADAQTITGLTIYQTIGNHDHSMYQVGDYNTVEEYKQVVAPTYYSFNVGNVHYVVLDDVECTNKEATTDANGKACYVRDYKDHLVDQQIDWLKKDLAFVPTSTPLVIAMHIPMYKPGGAVRMDGAAKLAAAVSAYPQVHVYTAHTHTIYNVDKTAENRIFEHNAGSICGTWWWSAHETPGVHIGQDGSPGGYTILKVNGSDFRWQYKPTGSDVSEQFRTYDRNRIHITADKYVASGNADSKKSFDPGLWATASSENEVYVNVWNWDPSWKVEVSESGTPLTVTRETQMDPLHLVAYIAKRLNKNSKATFATITNTHMFKVKASSATSTLEIKVTDGFGNVYTESMARPKDFSTDTYKH